jgi:hypothetical protein
MSGFTVEIHGLANLLRKCDARELLAGPLETFFNGVGRDTLNVAARRAPVDTGVTLKSLSKGAPGNIWVMKLSGGIPSSLRIGTRVSNRGFCYPKALDEDAKYHYRGGRAKGRLHPRARGIRAGLMGIPTKGWFSEAPKEADYSKYVRKLGEDIAKRWGR